MVTGPIAFFRPLWFCCQRLLEAQCLPALGPFSPLMRPGPVDRMPQRKNETDIRHETGDAVMGGMPEQQIGAFVAHGACLSTICEKGGIILDVMGSFPMV